MRRLLCTIALLGGAMIGLSGCYVAPAAPGYYRPAPRPYYGYGYGYRPYGYGYGYRPYGYWAR